MVVIRLSRIGAANTPKYRVNVADQRNCRDGKFIETVGHYIPTPMGKDLEIQLNMERVNHWISKGAQPTDRVKSLIKKVAKPN